MGAGRFVHAGAVVGDGDADITSGGTITLGRQVVDGSGDPDAAAITDGVAGVDHEVEQGCLELAGIQAGCRTGGVRLNRQIHAFADRPLQQRFAVHEQRIDGAHHGGLGLAAGKGQQALGQVFAAHGRGKRGFGHAFQAHGLFRFANNNVEGAHDDSQKVVEIVGHAAGQLAKRFQFL